jgi:hypothetical protein
VTFPKKKILPALFVILILLVGELMVSLECDANITEAWLKRQAAIVDNLRIINGENFEVYW